MTTKLSDLWKRGTFGSPAVDGWLPVEVSDLVDALQAEGAGAVEPVYEMDRIPIDDPIPEGWFEILHADDVRMIGKVVAERLVVPLGEDA